MKSSGYYIIQGWMVNELELKGNNLILFAIIYGFSQDGESQYTGSLGYLKGCMGAAKNTVINSLDFLLQKEFIRKETQTQNSITFCKYSYNEPVVQNLVRGGAKSELGGGANFGINNTILDNTKDNKKINKENFLLFYKTLSRKEKIEIQFTLGMKKNDQLMLFKESPYIEYEFLRNELIKNKEFVEKFKGVDLKYYIEKADTWSENNQKILRTERGWLKTLKDWITDAQRNGTMAVLPIKPEQQGYKNI